MLHKFNFITRKLGLATSDDSETLAFKTMATSVMKDFIKKNKQLIDTNIDIIRKYNNVLGDINYFRNEPISGPAQLEETSKESALLEVNTLFKDLEDAVKDKDSAKIDALSQQMAQAAANPAMRLIVQRLIIKFKENHQEQIDNLNAKDKEIIRRRFAIKLHI